MTNKLIICILTLLLLCGCSSSKVTENGTVNATTRIAYSISEDKIKVSNVIIKCNDNYYGVSVNDSINYNSNNNYFTTGSGLTVMITSDKLKTGSTTKDDIYTAASKIEDNVYLYVSGNDRDKVNEIFNNVFKTNKLSYTFLAHDIDDDWTKEVNITEDVISFSNGEDTIYAYQNPGSLSDGCINGRIEPTVFKKALRGIDIPITYPEDTNDEWDYIPYGIKEYEHWTNEGYTPYSAYQATEYGTEMVKTIEVQTEITKDEMTNYILLAKNDQAILSLFNDKNDHTQTLYSLSIPSGNTETLDLTSNVNLSNMKDLASSVINSENRYHFGVLTDKDDDGYWSYTIDCKNNYYNLEQTTYFYENAAYTCKNNSDLYTTYSEIIPNTMLGRLIIPTIRVAFFEYDGGPREGQKASASFKSISSKLECQNYINECSCPMDYSLVSESKNWATHGSENTIDNYVTNNMTYGAGGGNFHFINEGDYAYEINIKGELNIYKFVATSSVYVYWEKGLTTLVESPSVSFNDDFASLRTCSFAGVSGFNEYPVSVGAYSYER